MESLPLHLIRELQGPLCHPTLFAYADQNGVGDHLGMESLPLHLIRELQGPSVILHFSHVLIRTV